MNTHAMPRTSPRGFFPRHLGFTLIELMTVLVVLGAMMVLAAPSFREYQRNAALTNTANMLVSSVYRTRTEAMKEGMPAIMAPGTENGTSDTGWRGWIIYIDRDLSNTYTTGDDIVSVQAGDEIPDYITIACTADRGSQNFVKFNGAGFPRDSNNGIGALTLNVTRDGSTEARYIRRVKVASAGRVRTCRPDVDGANNCKEKG